MFDAALIGDRYRRWKRTGDLTPIQSVALWMVGVSAAFLVAVWFLSRP
jgi:hypothetical protein